METIGHQDAFDSKIEGENFSDIDNLIKGAALGMRAPHEVRESGSEAANIPAAELSASGDISLKPVLGPPDHLEWDPRNLQGHA